MKQTFLSTVYRFFIDAFKSSPEAKGLPTKDDLPLTSIKHNGWMGIPMDSYHIPTCLKAAIEAYNKIDQSLNDLRWMRLVRAYKREALACVAIMSQQEDPAEILNVKRCVTVSALAYGIDVPASLWLMDKQAADMAVRYFSATRLLTIDANKQELMEYCPVRNLPARIRAILGSTKAMHAIWSNPIPPNVLVVISELPEALKEEDDQFTTYQKILTSMYLLAELPIPSDYFYYDIEVHDCATRTGEFEKIKLRPRTAQKSV